MTMRHINPRSVEWFEAMMEDDNEPVSAQDALALRTMKALEEVEIRIALLRINRAQQPLAAATQSPCRGALLQLSHT